jgi:hypothetical protein
MTNKQTILGSSHKIPKDLKNLLASNPKLDLVVGQAVIIAK